MNFIVVENSTSKQCFIFMGCSLLISSIFFVFFGLSHVYGVEVYSKDDKPFGIPYDEWISKWWTWFITNTVDEATPKPNGCIIHNFGPMVGLTNPSTATIARQDCKISSKQGVMINLWSGWMEDSVSKDGVPSKFHGATYEQLSKAAREEADLGAITSQVTVDGIPIAKLDEVSTMRGGVLDYKINSMDNVTEVYSKGFNITIPEDTYSPDQNPGTWRTGAHGWWVFLKPLPPGDHTIHYNVGVTGTGPNDHSAEITYVLHVKPGQTGNTTMNIPSNDTILNSNTTNKS
jgi:hypothetical protein